MANTERTVKATFVVSVNLPLGVSASEMQDYIETEIQCGKGNRVGSDPMTNLDRHSVKVTYAGQEIV